MPGCGSCSSWSVSTRSSTPGAFPTSSPAASASGWAWPGRSGGDPPVLLMDEPFGAVDPVTRQRLQQQFLDLQTRRSRRRSSSSPTTSKRRPSSGDRIAVLSKGGVLEQYDTPAEMLGRPGHAPSWPTSSAPTVACGGLAVTPIDARRPVPAAHGRRRTVHGRRPGRWPRVRTAGGRWWSMTSEHLQGWVDLDRGADRVGGGAPGALRGAASAGHVPARRLRRNAAARRRLDSRWSTVSATSGS